MPRAAHYYRLTARDSLFAAASALVAQGLQEFSEWQLIRQAWTLDPMRFGMPGYEMIHPCSKRVYAEIMTMIRTKRTKTGYPPPPALIERVKPNFYQLTRMGWQRHDSEQRKVG